MITQALSIIVLILLSAFVGPFMALWYPGYSIIFKILLFLGLTISVGIIVFGVKKKRYLIIATGIVFWTMIGLIYGLSTGT
jgi:hypothetical protein